MKKEAILDAGVEILKGIKALNIGDPCYCCEELRKRTTSLIDDMTIVTSSLYSSGITMSKEHLKARLDFLLAGPIDNDCDGCYNFHSKLTNLRKTL